MKVCVIVNLPCRQLVAGSWKLSCTSGTCVDVRGGNKGEVWSAVATAGLSVGTGVLVLHGSAVF